jgi:hypothetical protein
VRGQGDVTAFHLNYNQTDGKYPQIAPGYCPKAKARPSGEKPAVIAKCRIAAMRL